MLIDPISWAHAWPYILAVAIGGYLLGSVPFGLVLARLAGYGDIRTIGSGNIGATNVLRTGNKPLAAAVLILDSGKGALAVLATRAILGPDLGLVAGVGAMLGHCFPVWLRFKGGKGVATALGTLLAGAFWLGLLACATWLLVAKLTRISSLAALCAVIAAPVWGLLLSQREVLGGDYASPQLVEFAVLIAVLVTYRHHANIKRLIKGTEPRIGEKAPSKADDPPSPPA